MSGTGPGAGGARFMYLFGIVVLVAVGAWYAFIALDRSALPLLESRAAVAGKEHRPAGTTYTRTVINNRTVTLPQSTAEAFVIVFSVEGRDAFGFVERDLYEELDVGDSVRVTYQRRRITGALQVATVTR